MYANENIYILLFVSAKYFDDEFIYI